MEIFILYLPLGVQIYSHHLCTETQKLTAKVYVPIKNSPSVQWDTPTPLLKEWQVKLWGLGGTGGSPDPTRRFQQWSSEYGKLKSWRDLRGPTENEVLVLSQLPRRAQRAWIRTNLHSVTKIFSNLSVFILQTANYWNFPLKSSNNNNSNTVLFELWFRQIVFQGYPLGIYPSVL